MQINEARPSPREKGGHFRVLIAWTFVGLAVGAFVGATVANRTVSRNAQSICQMLALTEYQNLALLQYKYADASHARQSMQDLLTFMDRVESSGLAPDKEVLQFDESLAYMRLALLEERIGDFEASRRHITAAAECSKKLKNHDASEAHLRQVTAKLDSYLP